MRRAEKMELRGFEPRRFTVTYRSGPLEDHSRAEAGRVLCEMYDSPQDFLGHLKQRVIPQRLREVAGLPEETDIEVLLDKAGYRNSLIAEELFWMIESCLNSGRFSLRELVRIREAFNGLAGPGGPEFCRIERFGSSARFESDGYPGLLSVHSHQAVYAS